VAIATSILSPWKQNMSYAWGKVTQKTISLQIAWSSLNAEKARPCLWDWLLRCWLLPLVAIQLLSCCCWTH